MKMKRNENLLRIEGLIINLNTISGIAYQWYQGRWVITVRAGESYWEYPATEDEWKKLVELLGV